MQTARVRIKVLGGRIGEGPVEGEGGAMDSKGLAGKWEQLAAEVISGMAEWRLQHPKATLSEIEAALDERLAGMRARFLEDAALASGVADLQREGVEGVVCAQCGGQVRLEGKRQRQVRTHGGQKLELERSYVICPRCEVGFFPPG